MEKSDEKYLGWDDPLIRKRKGQGFEKLKLYFDDLVKTGFLQKKCNWIRIVNDIPDEGYPSKIPDKAYDWAELQESPKKWFKQYGDEGYGWVNSYVWSLCDELGLYDDIWMVIIQNYVFYDKLPDIKYLNFGFFDLCNFMDETDIIESVNRMKEKKKNKWYVDGVIANINRAVKHFPLVIRISPYASERDIVDYITRHYDIIKKAQSKYTNVDIRIGKVRRKDEKTSERNEFIFKNRNLPLKEIVNLVGKEFDEVLDEGHIGKIISLENQKRWYVAGKRPKTREELRKLQGFRN